MIASDDACCERSWLFLPQWGTDLGPFSDMLASSPFVIIPPKTLPPLLQSRRHFGSFFIPTGQNWLLKRTMKATMKAWAQTELGGVEVLKILTVPRPAPSTVRQYSHLSWPNQFLLPGPRDLLTRVIATATNPVPTSRRIRNVYWFDLNCRLMARCARAWREIQLLII